MCWPGCSPAVKLDLITSPEPQLGSACSIHLSQSSQVALQISVFSLSISFLAAGGRVSFFCNQIKLGGLLKVENASKRLYLLNFCYAGQ